MEVFTKATGNESKGWSRGLIYVGHTGRCISKVESCTDATTAASIFPPSQLLIYIYNLFFTANTNNGIQPLLRRRHAATTITPAITLYPCILKLLLILYIYAYSIPTIYYIMYLYIIYVRKVVFQCYNKMYTMYT